MTKRSLLLLVLGLLVVRGVLVVSLADVFGYGEELAKGAAAKAMLDDLGVDHWRLNYAQHEGGGFVVTHLKAVAFLLVGESLLANKLVALFTSSLLLLAGCLTAAENFGRRAGWVFGLLFVFAAGSLQRFSLLSLGTHFEALLFITLVFRYTLRILAEPDIHLGDWVKLGLAAGFGTYFSMQTAPVVAWCGLFLLLGLRRRFFGVCTLAGLAGLAVGALPLLWLSLFTDARSLEIRGSSPISSQWRYFGEGIRGFFAPVAADGSVLRWAVFLLQIGVVVVGAWLFLRGAKPGDKARRAYGLLLGYLPLFVVLYASRSGPVGDYNLWFLYIRSLPLPFLGLVLVAATLARLLESPGGGARRFALTVLVAVLLSGTRDATSLAREGRPGPWLQNVRILRATKGYSYLEYFPKFLEHLEGSRAERMETLLRFDEPDRELLTSAIAFAAFEGRKFAFQPGIHVCRQVFGDELPGALLGLGRFAHVGPLYDVPLAIARIEKLPPDVQHALVEALGRTGLSLRNFPGALPDELAVDVPDRFRLAWVRGVGYRVYLAFPRDPEGAAEFLERQPEPTRRVLVEGYERALADYTLP